MTDLMLKSIKTAMSALNLRYGFINYDVKPIVYPYFVGEYTEAEGFTEDGQQSATFMLTGFSNAEAGWQALESAKTSIENYFTREGRLFRSSDGTAAVIMYGYSFPVPKEDAEIKSIQINLTVKEWSVN